MKELFEKVLIKEFWGRKKSIPIAICVALLVGVCFYLKIISENNIICENNGESYPILSPTGEILVLISVVAISLLLLIYIGFVFSKYYIRKPNKEKIGIMMYIDTDNEELYNDTVRKFGEEFKKSILSGFELVYIPYDSMVIEKNDARKITSLMIRKRCLLFLKVAINYDKCDDTILYDMSLDAVILHRMYADSVERKFKKEFSEVLKNFRRVSFETKDMMGKMRATASDLSICCNYIMGLSFFLNAEFLNAEKVFEALWLRIQFDDKWRKMADSVNILRYKMFMTIALTHLDRYENQSAEKQDLLLTEEYLEKGNALIKNTYIYNLHKAYVCVAKNQDIKQARHYINMCKQTCKGDVSWKYSEAFLRAYEDRTIGSIVSGYKAALKVKYNIVNLIYFIEKVLEAHPERRGLHLALAILYEDNEDYQLAKEHFDLYVSSSENADKTKDILRKKGICCFGTVL